MEDGPERAALASRRLFDINGLDSALVDSLGGTKNGGNNVPAFLTLKLRALYCSENTFNTPESFGMLFHGSPYQSP
jgi:hypothetical protein